MLSIDIYRTLSSPPTLKTGRFARLAQAINLLSQVLRQIPKEDKIQLDPSDMMPLDRTLFALERLIEIEEAQRGMIFCCGIAVCYKSISPCQLLYKMETDREEARYYSYTQWSWPIHSNLRLRKAKTLHISHFKQRWQTLCVILRDFATVSGGRSMTLRPLCWSGSTDL